jgi:hypothetical protein
VDKNRLEKEARDWHPVAYKQQPIVALDDYFGQLRFIDRKLPPARIITGY